MCKDNVDVHNNSYTLKSKQMEKTKNIFENAISIEELETRFEMSSTGLGAVLANPSCIGPTPPFPPQTGN